MDKKGVDKDATRQFKTEKIHNDLSKNKKDKNIENFMNTAEKKDTFEESKEQHQSEIDSRKSEELVKEISEENKKYDIIELICLTIASLPTIILIVLQTLVGVLSFFNLGVLLVMTIVFVPVIKSLRKKEDKSFEQSRKSQIKTNIVEPDDGRFIDVYTGELKEKYKMQNVNVKTQNQTNKSTKLSGKSKYITKIVCAVLAIIYITFGFVTLNSMVYKYSSDEYKTYDAEIIKVVDKTTYETDGDTETTTVNDACEVTFRYFDGENYITKTKTFTGVSGMSYTNLKIIIKDDKIVATEYQLLTGKFLSGYLFLLAIISILFVLLPLYENLMAIVTGFLFSSALCTIAIPLSIEPRAILYSEWISVATFLGAMGLCILIFGFYLMIKDKMKNKVSKIIT